MENIDDALKEYLEEYCGRKIIIVSNYYPPFFIGGAEIIAHEQAKTMQNLNFAKVIAVTIDASDKNHIDSVVVEKVDNILVLRIAVCGDVFSLDGINFFNRYINSIFDDLCKKVKPDIVHCHNLIGTSLGIIDIAQKSGAKVCVTLHDHWGFCFKNTMIDVNGTVCCDLCNCYKCMANLNLNGIHIPIGVRQNYFRRMLSKLDAYISPSKYLANAYIYAGFDADRMHVIWNGIDVNRFKNIKRKPADKVRITFIGNFGKHKGVDVLIKAVSYLNDKNVVVNLVGDGTEIENYKHLAVSCGILDQIIFWGKVPNKEIEKVYAETDVFCLPSIWPENQPVTITEAMACGIPVLASNTGGSEELVRDGVTGYLFETGNYTDLAYKIRRLVCDKKLLNEFGAAGKKIIAKNDFVTQIKTINKLYDRLLKLSACEKYNKKIIAFKGKVLPKKIDKFTDKDVLLWDWLISEEDYKNVEALILMGDEALYDFDIMVLKKHSIDLWVDKKNYHLYSNKNIKIKIYTYIQEVVDSLFCYKEIDVMLYADKIDCANNSAWLTDSLYGVYHCENGFAWVMPYSKYELKSKMIGIKGIELEVGIPSHIFTDNNSIDVSIYINDERVYKNKFSKPWFGKIYIEGSKIKDVNQYYCIEIFCSKYFNPKLIGINDDDRDLAIQIMYIGETR